MIDHLNGIITAVEKQTIIMVANGIGFKIMMADSAGLQKDTTSLVYIHAHWVQDGCPVLYGFQKPVERTTFLLIIDCPKIGPSIALSILSQLGVTAFLDAIITNDEKALSSVSGIGTKKAEQMIVQLKHKVEKAMLMHDLQADAQSSFVQWQQVREVLSSLNYSQQETSRALSHLNDKYAGQQCSLDTLIRSALTFLSSGP